MDQYIGKMLDNRYEILELIGVGGMAKVYKARCHRLNRLVAIKILRDDLSQDAELRRRFHDESQAVAMLSHPNIVAVYDVSRSSDLEYIVMELIDGINLKQYMQKRGEKLNWREALHFITQIIKALGHAHSRGIIHRDIKPHNIMVLRDGSVKVADFGIARLASAGHSTLTQETLGSVHYISPEQARGSHIDTRSDIYSAGVVLYEMITGRLPFEGDSPVSVAIQHINSIPLSPRELNQEIPEALEAITMKAMAPNPDERYSSADEMLADLEEFRKNPNINFDYNAGELQTSLEDEMEERTQVITVSSISRREREALRDVDRTPASRGRSRRRVEEEYEEEYDDYPRRGPILPMFVAVIAILGFTAAIFYVLFTSFIEPMFQTPPAYTIPNLVGQMYDTVLQDTNLIKGFRVVQSNSINSEDPEGTILRQSPDAYSSTKDPNAEITVVVSAGPEYIEMINVENYDYATARLELTNMGLTVSTPEYRTDEEVANDHVISFTPQSGTMLRPGDEVQLVVSLGPERKPVTVPLFIGQSEEWAMNQINLFKLGVDEPLYVWSDDMPEGYVIDQNPAAYEKVYEGDPVRLMISKGPDPSTIPEPPEGPNDPNNPNEPNDPNNPGDPNDPEGPGEQGDPDDPDDPNQTDPPDNPPPQTTKTFNIDLPDNFVELHVTVAASDGQIVLNQMVDALEAILPCTVTGTGVVTYSIYFDGEFVRTQTVDFGS